MTPLEAIAEALNPHVWDNDPNLGRWCLRFLQSLKASGYELMKLGDSEKPAHVFGHDVRTDALAHLKALEKKPRDKRQ